MAYQSIPRPPSDSTNLVAKDHADLAPSTAPAATASPAALFASYSQRPTLQFAAFVAAAILVTIGVTHHYTLSAVSAASAVFVNRGYVAPKHGPPVPDSDKCAWKINNCLLLDKGTKHLEYYLCVRCCDEYIPSGSKPSGFYDPTSYLACLRDRDTWASKIGKSKKK